jgi:hypothetical protein
LEFGLNRRLGKITAFGRYSLAWNRTDGEGIPANNYDLRSEWGRANNDRRHSVFVGGFVTLPKGFRLNTMINAFSGAPFNIITGFDDNGDGAINDRPLGIGRNASLPASLYSQLPDRLICVPGTSPSRVNGAFVCNPGGSPQVQLRDFLAKAYPNGVNPQGPGNFTVNAFLSKTIGFGRRSDNGNAQQIQNDPGFGGRGGRGGGGGGGRGGGPGGGPGGGGPRMMGGGLGGPGGPGGPGGMMMGGPGGGAEGSRYNITFTIGATNLFNRVNFGQYSGTLGSAFFGLPSSSAPARQLDFNVRFSF